MEKKHKLVHNKADKCYEFDLNGQKAKIEYIEAPGFMVLTHTEVPEEYEGQGIGKELVCAVLEEVRANRLKVIPSCVFIAHYIHRHPEWADVVMTDLPDQ